MRAKGKAPKVYSDAERREPVANIPEGRRARECPRHKARKGMGAVPHKAAQDSHGIRIALERKEEAGMALSIPGLQPAKA